MVLFDQQPQIICLVEAWKQIDLSDLSCEMAELSG